MINPVRCWACGRTWMLGEALQLAGRRRVCPHAGDCNQQKDRDRMVREFKRCFPGQAQARGLSVDARRILS